MAKSGCDAVYAGRHTKRTSRTATRKQEPHIVRIVMDMGGSTMAKQEVMCIKCYKYYVGSLQSKYCPECRKLKRSESATRNKLVKNFGPKYTTIKDLDLKEEQWG